MNSITWIAWLEMMAALGGQNGLAVRSRIVEEPTTEIVSVAWSPDGEGLAIGSRDGSIRLWSLLKCRVCFRQACKMFARTGIGGRERPWRGCERDRRPARHMEKAAQAPCLGRVLRRTSRRDVHGGAETWRSAHATQRRDRAGQPGPTEHEVDSTFAPGGPRSASGTETVGTNCCR